MFELTIYSATEMQVEASEKADSKQQTSKGFKALYTGTLLAYALEFGSDMLLSAKRVEMPDAVRELAGIESHARFSVGGGTEMGELEDQHGEAYSKLQFKYPRIKPGSKKREGTSTTKSQRPRSVRSANSKGSFNSTGFYVKDRPARRSSCAKRSGCGVR